MKGIMNLYYEDYYKNEGNTDGLKEYTPYVVFCENYRASVHLIDFLVSEGYDKQKGQGYGHNVVLVNTELRRVSGISIATNHSGIKLTEKEFLDEFYPELSPCLKGEL